MALAPGSIAFTGFNADGNDSLAFVALAAIPGTEGQHVGSRGDQDLCQDTHVASTG